VRRAALGFLALAACATRPPAPAPVPPASSPLIRARVATAKSIAIAGVRPLGKFGADTRVRAALCYADGDLVPGADRVAAFLVAKKGAAVPGPSQLLAEAHGSLELEFVVAELLANDVLERPLRATFAIQRRQPGQDFVTLVESRVVYLELPGAALLPPKDGMQLLSSDIRSDRRFRLSLPPALNRPGMKVSGVFAICVDAQGSVSAVEVIKSADALVDDNWMKKMKTWQYRPHLVDGQPASFCHPIRAEVEAVE
jgi:hypothetical protein